MIDKSRDFNKIFYRQNFTENLVNKMAIFLRNTIKDI